jgi:hypothetical protein
LNGRETLTINQLHASPNASPLRQWIPPAGTSLLPAATFGIEVSILAYYVCLLYKIQTLGILCLLAMVAFGALFPFRWQRLSTPLVLVGALYLLLSTSTAFYYSFDTGLYRTIQFAIMLPAGLLAANYIAVRPDAADRLVRLITLLTVLVAVHVVVFHIAVGRLVTWKYLFDTKTIFSLGVVLLFYYEDQLRRFLSAIGWYAVMGGVGTLVLLSGERKAYLVFLVIFLLSKASLATKLAITLTTSVVLMVYAQTAGPEDYVAKQINSLFEAKEDYDTSEFYSIDAVGSQSNIIRDFVNRMAHEQFLEHPVFGLGAGGYDEWAKRELPGGPNGLTLNVHGEVNRIPAESGILGIIVGIALLALLGYAVLARLLVRARYRPTSADRLHLYFFVFVVAYAWYEAVDTLMLSAIFGFALLMAGPLTVRLPWPRDYRDSIGRSARTFP